MNDSIYDNPEFFDRYLQFSRQQHGLDGAPEWPTMRSLLPPIEGARVLDLGCGLGWFSAWASQQGAAQVDAIDSSVRMIDGAHERHGHLGIDYVAADLSDGAFGPGSYDVVHSSLVFHYLADFGALAASVAAVLVEGGRFVFSVEHPIFTAPTRAAAISIDADAPPVWPLDRYSEEGERTRSWLVDGVRKYHRTVATYVNCLVDAGIAVERLVEYGPEPEDVAANPGLEIDRNRPAFLIVQGVRQSGISRRGGC